MELLIIGVVALLAVVGATSLGNRLGVATPLLLVVAGIVLSLIPIVPDLPAIDPEWILAGVLPPLLYSTSVSMPTMDFRRDIGAISGLSVVLVVITSVVTGLFFAWLIPGVGLWWGIALGAIVSPTDAVATSIVKRAGVSQRVVTLLEGESLLNDASALVLLRTAIAGAAASVTFWGVVGDFAYAVLVAIGIGMIVGRLNLSVRARIRDPTVNTVISFTIPFVASIPAELAGASGLVAAVAAGMVTGRGAARRLSPQHRISDEQNWRTVELVLEGVVFLLMGLELASVAADVQRDHAGIGVAAALAGGALLLTILVRTGYVTPLLLGLRRRARRGEAMKVRIQGIQERLDHPDAAGSGWPPGGRRGTGPRQPPPALLERFRTRMRRSLADVDYFLAEPLGWRDGGIVVWAGMRGAVTLAAAQTLPADTPSRSLLVFVAFLVAAGSLILQGGTLPTVARRMRAVRSDAEDTTRQTEERMRLLRLLKHAAEDAAGPVPEPLPETATDEQRAARRSEETDRRLAMLRAQRNALLDARDDGLFSATALSSALAVLDAHQVSLELKGGLIEE